MRSARARAFHIPLVALLIAMVGILELLPKPRAPWGMSIDLVAVPVLIAFFLLGTRYALAVSIGMLVILSFIGGGSYIGATMKFTATLPMFLMPALLLYTPFFSSSKSPRAYAKLPKYLAAVALAIMVRCLAMIALNYYWAVPLFLGMPIEKAIEMFFFGSIWGFIWFVSSMNIVQGIVDAAASWIIVFGAKLHEKLPKLS
ncbi:MAG TPA: hypothetical protein ENF82_04515 [Candidatus Methanomethylia archaeon]|nr:hypothetical protein [Candidatus Methanomethylicia archaeon]